MPQVVTIPIGKFLLDYDGYSTVSVSASAETAEEFDSLLDQARELLRKFKRTGPGSDWGCDGVGYAIQKRKRFVYVHRSGVGPRVFSQTLRTLVR
jgi:hypothetical protein